MRLNSKGQVTIPADLRRKYALEEGDEVEVVEVGNTLRIVRQEGRNGGASALPDICVGGRPRR